MRLLHHKSGGATDGAENIILMMRMEESLTPIKIRTWESCAVRGCLYEMVKGKKFHLGTFTNIRYRLFW